MLTLQSSGKVRAGQVIELNLGVFSAVQSAVGVDTEKLNMFELCPSFAANFDMAFNLFY